MTQKSKLVTRGITIEYPMTNEEAKALIKTLDKHDKQFLLELALEAGFDNEGMKRVFTKNAYQEIESPDKK